MSEGEPISLNGKEIDPKLESVIARLEERTNGHPENPKLDLPPRPQILRVNDAELKKYSDVEQRVLDELQLTEARRDIWQAAAERAVSMRNQGPVHFYDAAFAKDVEGLSPIDPKRAEKNFRNAQKAFLAKWADGAKEYVLGLPENSPLRSAAALIQENHADGPNFHSMVVPLILPMAAGQAQQALSAETDSDPEAMMHFYAALKSGAEGNGGGWIIDPFNMKGKNADEIRAAFPLPENGALSARPHDGIFDELPQGRVIFLPFAVAGDQGGVPVTQLISSADVYNPS